MRYVVVGLHAAGRSACTWLRKVDKTAEIIGIDPSPQPVYSRPLISYVLSGELAARDMHIHISGIEYGPKGEKRHLSLGESDFDYTACLKALRAYGVKGCVICEDPLLEYDALLLQKTYRDL